MIVTRGRLALSIVAGLLAQAGLAMLAWWGIPGVPPQRAPQGVLASVWRDRLPSDLGPPAMVVTLEGIGRTYSQITWNKKKGEDDGLLGVIEGGWPFRSMTGSYLNVRRSGTWEYSRWWTAEVPKAVRPSWHLKDGQGPFTIMPLRPLVVGTALNTLVWGGLFFGGWVLVDWRRTRARVQRGECTRCGYPMGSLPRCPECGHRPTAA